MARRSGFVNFFAISLAIATFIAAHAAHAATYYVSLSGNNGNTGTSPGTGAWRTITYAATKARSGDTVYIEGGDYGNEKVVVSNTGYSTGRIVFEGYNGTPVLNMGSRPTTDDYGLIGFRIVSKNYITVKNINATLYLSCFQLENCQYLNFENCTAYTCGYTGAVGYGFDVDNVKNSMFKNCTVTDCGGADWQLTTSDNNTFEDCQAIGTLSGSSTWATDYYLVCVYSSNNIFRRWLSHDSTYTGKGNHGIGIKDQGSSSHGKSTGNQFIDCTAWGLDEGLYVAHGCYGNTFTNCVADFKNKYDPFATGIMVRDGAHDNLFQNCTAIGCGQAVCIYAGAENRTATQYNNRFVNCVIQAKERDPALPTSPIDYLHPNSCFFFRNAQNNTFEKCTLLNGKSVFRFGKNYSGVDANSGNAFNNCTIYNNTKWYDTQTLTVPWTYSGSAAGYDDTANVTWTNCNFYQNGFTTPAGTGNGSFQPIFIDPANGNYLVPFGSLTVSMSPAAAISAGAMWRRVGQTTWRASGSAESDIMANLYTVQYLQVPGFNSPANQDVTIGLDPKSLTGIYTQMSLVWVDFGFGGSEYGTDAQPYKTVVPAVSAVTDSGTIRIKAGSSSQTMRLTKPVRLESAGGTATIGK